MSNGTIPTIQNRPANWPTGNFVPAGTVSAERETGALPAVNSLENPPFIVPTTDFARYQAAQARAGNLAVTAVLPAPSPDDSHLLMSPGDYFAIVVDSALYPSILTSLDQYVLDLQAEGYAVAVFLFSGGTAADLRDLLSNEYYASGLKGAALVGDLPVAWYKETTSGYAAEYPFDLYFMDLDGSWLDTDTDGIFDSHLDGADPGTEIYVGRLSASTLTGGGDDQVALLQNYFAKNHAYRTGALSLPKRALYYSDLREEDDLFRLDLLYHNVDQVTNQYVTNAQDYLHKLTSGPGFEFVQLIAHSAQTLHGFYVNNTSWVSYGDSAGLVTSADIRNADPRALFYVLVACTAARYTETDYLAGWYTFADTYGLAAVGATNPYGFGSFQYFYEELAAGKNLGEAFLRKIGDYPGIEPKLVIIGDPTLTIEADTSPAETTIPTATILPMGTLASDVLLPVVASAWGVAHPGSSPAALFDRYELDLGAGTYPAAYANTVTSYTERTGMLGLVDGTSLAGEHLVRLTVYDANGDYSADIKWVNFDPLRQDGWPKNLGNWYDDHLGYPLVADLDGDGQAEIGINVTYLRTAPITSRIYFWTAGGGAVPGWPIDLPEYGAEKVLAADLNLDGKLEVVGGTSYNTYVWDRNGVAQPGYPASGLPMALADIDHNGTIEVISASGSQLYAREFDGSVPAGWPANLGAVINSVSTGDIDGDYRPEVLAVAGYGTSLHVIKADGTEAPGWPLSTSAYTGYDLFTADVDGDGRSDVLYGQRDGVINARAGDGTNLPGFPVNLGISDYTFNNFAPADFNDDGLPEIMAYFSGQIHLLDRTGADLPDFPQAQPSNGLFTAADLDGDLVPELAYADDRRIRLLTAGGELVSANWPFATENYALRAPVVADIDGDNNLEMVIASADGKIYARRLGAPENYPDREWRQQFHDCRSTSDFGFDIFPPTINHAPVVSAEAGSTLIIAAQLTDNRSALTGKVFYKRPADTAYDYRWLMTFDHINWTAYIPGAAVTLAGLQYYLVGFDSALNPRLLPLAAPEGGVFNVAVTDTTPPAIAHTATTVAEACQSLPLTAQITENAGLSAAELYYKITVSGSWNSLDLTASGTDYTAAIPADQVTLAGLQYYFRAQDVSSHTTLLPAGAPADPDTFHVTVLDTADPALNHVPVTSAGAGEDITLALQASDACGVANTLLFYRTAGDSAWVARVMTASGSSYEATIPGSDVTPAGIEYYLQALDINTNASTLPASAPSDFYYIEVLDTTPDAGTDSGTDADTDIDGGFDGGGDIDADADSDADTDTGVDADADSDTGDVPDTDTLTPVDADLPRATSGGCGCSVVGA